MIGQCGRVRIDEFGRSSVTLTFTTPELSLVNNALNEVCTLNSLLKQARRLPE